VLKTETAPGKILLPLLLPCVLWAAVVFAGKTAPAAGTEKLTIERAVAIALTGNDKLAVARMSRDRAAHRKKEALGLALPDLTLSANYTREFMNPELEFFGETFKLKPDESYALNASLEQYLYSGSVSAGYRAAGRLLERAGSDVGAARNDVIALVRSRFYEALFTRELIVVNQESVGQLRSHLSDSKEREAVGLNTAYDTLRFETRLAEALPELLSAKNAHHRAVLDLLDTIGADPLAPVEIVGELTFEPMAVLLESALASANERRPELAAARQSIMAAEEISRAARGEQLPTVKTFVNYRVANSAGLGDQTERMDDLSAGVKVEMNLFDGRERSSRVAQRRVDASIARIESDRIRRRVAIEVKTAHDELKRAGEFVQSQVKSVDLAGETYRIASVSHAEGVVTQLELLDAQLALTRAKINHGKALYEYLLAKTRLERAMGVIEPDGK